MSGAGDHNAPARARGRPYEPKAPSASPSKNTFFQRVADLFNARDFWIRRDITFKLAEKARVFFRLCAWFGVV